MLPSTTGSSAPVTVTVCGVAQSAVVKERETGETVPSVASEELSPMLTSAVGWESRFTLKVACPPDSVVTSPEVGVTVMPDVGGALPGLISRPTTAQSTVPEKGPLTGRGGAGA